MLNFFKSFSSNIHYNYSVQSRPSFTAGCWAVYDAKSKSTNEPVSVFVLDKKSASEAIAANGIKPRSAVLAEVWEFAKRGVEQLTKLRHPAVLRLVEPLESSKGSLSFVTERVTGTLNVVSNSELDELAIVRGLTTVVQALSFLHESLGIVHSNVTPETVFVDAQGDWKLAGLEFVVNFEEHSGSEYFLPQLDPRMPKYMQPPYDFLAPEMVINKRVCPANDVWSLACLIYTLFVRKPPMHTRNNPSAYKDELRQFMKHISATTTTSKFPANLQPYLPALFCEEPEGRLGLAALETTDFFQNPLIKALKSIDEFAAKPVDEKVAFLKHFEQLLPQFPKQMRIRKILKFATVELSGPRDPATATLVGNVLFAVCSDMSRLTFQEQVLPLFTKLQDYLQFQESAANNLEVIARATSDKDFSKFVLPMLVDLLKHHDAQHAPIQTRVLSSAETFKDNLTIPKLEQTLFPAVIDCFAATPARSVKVAATQCLSVLVQKGVSKALIGDNLIPALERMKTRDPAVTVAVSKLWETVTPKLSTQQVFEQAVPHLLQLSLSNQLTVAQFKSITATIRREIETVEKSQVKILASNKGQVEEDDWLTSPPPANTLANGSTNAVATQAPNKPVATPKTIPGPKPELTDIFDAPVVSSAGAAPATQTAASKPTKPWTTSPSIPPVASATKPLPSPVPKASPAARPSPVHPAATTSVAVKNQPMNAMKPTSMAAMKPTSFAAPQAGMMMPLVPTSTTLSPTPASTSAGSASMPVSSYAALQPLSRPQQPRQTNTAAAAAAAAATDDFGSFVSSSNGDSLI